jgi:hypothetical protein
MGTGLQVSRSTLTTLSVLIPPSGLTINGGRHSETSNWHLIGATFFFFFVGADKDANSVGSFALLVSFGITIGGVLDGIGIDTVGVGASNGPCLSKFCLLPRSRRLW